MEHIDAAITDIGRVEHLLVQHGSNAGGPHAKAIWTLPSLGLVRLAESDICLLNGMLKGGRDVMLKIVVVGVPHLLDGQLAGNVAEIMAAHAVGDHKERAFVLQKLLVVGHYGNESIFIVG